MNTVKKLIACALIVASLLCALPVFAENVGDYSAQLPAFVNQVSIWKPKSKASYCYTDLDQDGYLEVLTSFTSKKGEVTNELYELRDGRLTAVELPWGKDDAQPEIKESSVPVYFDEAEGRYYFVFGAQGETPAALSLKDGVLSSEFLAVSIDERFAGMQPMVGTFGWISTAEHTLKDAPLEQLKELGADSLSAFKVKEP